MAPIPWSVLNEWRSRMVAEHMSGLITQSLHGWLVELGAPESITTACERIIDDERAHSRMSGEVYGELGGDVKSVHLAKKPVLSAVPARASRVRKALTLTASVFCCGESVAVPLFLAMRRNATKPQAITVLQRILRDEGRHRAFGWKTLTHLLDENPKERAWLRTHVPGYMDAVVDAYTGPARRLSSVEKSWGLLEPARYAEIVRGTRKDVLEPRFRKLGLV